MGDLFGHLPISGPGGGIALFFTVLLTVIGFGLKRLATGEGEIRSGYSGLLKDVNTVRQGDLDRLLDAERRARLEHGWRVRAEEYAYGLETAHGVQHRRWTYEDEGEGDSS